MKPMKKGAPPKGLKRKSQSVKGTMPQFYDASSKKPETDDKPRPRSRKNTRQKLLGVRL